MKHFDATRNGNDCLIYEHWYWLPEAKCALMVYWFSDTPERKSSLIFAKYCRVNVPIQIKEWFCDCGD